MRAKAFIILVVLLSSFATASATPPVPYKGCTIYEPSGTMTCAPEAFVPGHIPREWLFLYCAICVLRIVWWLGGLADDAGFLNRTRSLLPMPPVQTEQQLLDGIRQFGAWCRRRPLIPAFVVLDALVSAGAALTLNLKGYCYAEGKFISKQKMFDASIAVTIAQSIRPIQHREANTTIFKLAELVRHPDRESFRKANPDCCTLLPFNTSDAAPYITMSQHLSGHAAGVVKLDYTATYRWLGEDRTERNTRLVDHYVVTNCGRPWSARH